VRNYQDVISVGLEIQHSTGDVGREAGNELLEICFGEVH
jgi:hypothetical protein